MRSKCKTTKASTGVTLAGRTLGAWLLSLFMVLAIAGPAAHAADVVVAIDDNSNIWSADSNGDGTFANWRQLDYLGGSYSRGVAVNDFDNDGDMDFVAGRGISSTGYYYLFLNDGANNFTKSAMVGTQSNASSYAMDMATGDFNNDGNMDFVANGNQSTTGIYLGDGKGGFSKTEVNWGAYGRGMDTADFDHDGHTDIVRGRNSSGYIDVYWGDGSGTFSTSTYLGDVGSDPYGVVAGDFDGDGHPDVIANNGSNGDTYFIKGNGDGTFQAAVYEASLDLNNHGAFDAFDYDGDGALDVLIANYTGRTVYYYPGYGDGTFGAAVTIGGTGTNCMAVSAPPSEPPVNRPVAVIAPPGATISAGAAVDFDGSGSSDSDGTITGWDWTFGDGGTDSVADPAAYTYAAEGTYAANLTVTDNDGKTDVASATVVVEGDAPAVDTTAVTFGEADASDGVWPLVLDGADYAADTEGIASCLWDLGDGLVEDFEDDDAAGWKVYAGTWAIEDGAPLTGAYSYRQTNTSDDRTWTLFDKVFDTDLVITADVHLVAGSGEEAHVLFHAKDERNNYEFILRGRGNDDVLLYRRVNGGATNVYEYDLPDAIFGTNYIDVGYSYAIKVVCTGSLIQFYLDGKFLFACSDGTFSSGRVGFSTYRTDAVFDNLTVSTVASGQTAAHKFIAGAYSVLLTATDSAGQSDSGIIPMTMAPGAPPLADAGGPYTADESAAFEGGWTVALDGSGSTDDVEIQTFVWDLGTDTFDGTEVNAGKWSFNGSVSQIEYEVGNTGVEVAHPSSGWGQQYFFSKDTYARAPGMAFEARIKQVSGYTMIGLKNTNNTFQYGQMPYAIYFYYGNINIYEDGSSKGDTGYDIAYNVWYDIRIELKETQGARYYYRQSGDPDWILLYDSDYSTATEFKRGLDVGYGTFWIDDVKEIAAGPTPGYRFYGPAAHPILLTVTDRAGQSDTQFTTVTTTGGAFPSAHGGPDLALDETTAAGGTWTVAFDASGSTDDWGIYTYEWDWNYDGTTFVPSGDTGAAAAHAWDAPGTYRVAVRVTDHALQSHVDEIQVVITQGTPPTANAGGPYAADETTGNVFEGTWTVTLDGTGSSDDTGLDRYLWDLGTETFDGTEFLGGKWYTNGGISQDDAVAVTGTSNWGDRYIVSRGTVPNEAGQVFQARVKDLGTGDAMLGFKNTSTASFSYTQFPYQFYLYDRNIYIYEYNNNRGDTGYNIATDTWYDFRIELTPTGAVYSYKPATDSAWTVVYTSAYQPAEAALRKGMVVHNSTFLLDDFLETAGGPAPIVYLSGLGSHTIHLTVYDQAGQSGTDSSSVTTSANAPPSADAGADQSKNEGDAVHGEWTVDFSGTAGDDGPNGVYLIEWDFDYDGSTFAPSGETGDTVSHVYDAVGVHTVAMRASDHALQSVIDTITVTITAGAVPTADAGADMTTEGELYVRFNGTGSTDDLRIYKYEWDFGDKWDSDPGHSIKGTGPTPAHIYHTPGTYTATLTITDEANQTGTDTVTVNVLAAGAASAPTADAGGPYTAGAGGPPAYLNASASGDDYGIVKYFWDVDDTVDSDGDGNFTNDRNVFGRKPFYTYAAGGSYTVTLTVEDGAGQQATAASTVNVATNLAPDVICVPWRGADPTIPHEAIGGESVRLKGIVRDAGDLEYRWDFGDGTFYPADGTSWLPVANKSAIEADHTYTGAVGTPYSAVLQVKDSGGEVGQDIYYLEIGPNNYDTRTNIAIDNGLWYVHKAQIRPAGYWQFSSYELAATASSLQAFVINGHAQGGDHQEDPYVETVTTGYDYLFTRLRTRTIGAQTAGDPDANGNGFGIEIDESYPIYQGGPTMDAIASTNTPGAFNYFGGSNVKNRYYLDILRDMADTFAWGQGDSGAARGGWRYNWGNEADNSACQWAAIGMIAAEDNFGIWIPDFVKTENNDYWLQYSYDGTGFGYTSAGNGQATTPSGMVQLAFDEVYTSDPRWQTAEDYLANHWNWPGTFYYATYAMSKALRLGQPNPVVTFGATGLDWYNDPDSGLRKYLVDRQEAAGSWLGSSHGGGTDKDLSTPWVVIMLTPALFTQPPEADAGDDIIWAFDQELAFDASGSRHLDPLRHIVKYEWDFDGDGTYDFTTADPADPSARYTYPDPNPGTDGDPPEVYVVKLRVTDDNDPAQTDIDTREVTVAEPPHAPFAAAGGPYTATAGIPFTLDGSGSWEIDPGDSITSYQWDLDHDGVFFDDVDLSSGSASATWTYDTPGVYNIALKVLDNGAYNPVGCTIGVDCTPLESLPDFTTVTVVENLAPVADAGGPYTVPEGTPLSLDGSGSSDPNGDALTYAWDLDADGVTDDSTDAQPSWTYMDDGPVNVTLTVSDTLLNGTTTAVVTVTDLGPGAAFTWNPEPPIEGTAVSFADASNSFPDTIVSWAWDFGGLGTGADQHPAFTFNDDGTYTVTLTVTDEDGSTDTVSHEVTVADKAPSACLTGDTAIDEGQIGNFDAGCSASSPDAIVSYEWDWNYDGTTFNPSADTGAVQTHLWADNGVFTVAVRVTDDDGSTAIATLSVTVHNVAPTVEAGPDQTVDEGAPVGFAGSATDPGADTHTFTWDFGDGTSPAGGMTASHIYAIPGTYTVTLTVVDDDGGVGSDTLTVTVNDLPIDVDAGADQTGNEGDTLSFSGGFTDPSSAGPYTYAWDFGDGGTASGTLTPAHTYVEDGVYTVTLTVTNANAETSSDTLLATIGNVAPDVDAGPDQAIVEGGTVTLAPAVFSDPGSLDTHTAVIDWGDGAAGPGVLDPAAGTVSGSHVYADDGTYTVTVTVTDDDGAAGSDPLAVTVANVAPAVDAGDDQTVNQGDTVTFAGSFTDPGTADTHTFVWNFGDGSPPAPGTLTPSHVFGSAGTYIVSLTVFDDDGGTGADTLVVTVVEGGNPPICGDLDHDGDVDGDDRNILRNALNACTGDARFVSEADYDGDGCITYNDYRLWYTCYRDFIS